MLKEDIKEKFYGSKSDRAMFQKRLTNKRKAQLRRGVSRLAFVFICVFILIFSFVKFVSFCIYKLTDDFSFSYSISPDNSACDSLEVIKKDYAIGIQYPLINEKIDKVIEGDAKKLFKSLKKEVRRLERGKKENRAVYTTNYTLTQNDKNYISLLYTIHRYNPASKIDDIKYSAKVYDTQTSEELTPDVIFAEDYSAIISDFVVNTLREDKNFAHLTSSELFSKKTAPEIKNFSNIGFDNKIMKLYFGAGELFGEETGAISLNVPLSQLYDIMKINITNYTPPAFDPNLPMIALTFDDGPQSTISHRILDVLEKVNGRATFFILGNRIAEQKDVIKRGDAMGCEYGNHSWNHLNLSTASEEDIAKQINLTDDALKKVTGKITPIARAPYAATNDTVFEIVEKPFIGWNIDTLDWKTRNAQSIKDEILSKADDGDIILMHDIYESTALAVEAVVPELARRGFQFVTVSELMEAKGISINNGSVYHSAN